MFDVGKEYSHIKGFNIQPDWGRNGIEIWLNFDEERYHKLIRIGKDRFPTMNTVRIWLSFDAWMQDRKTYLEAVRKAGEILTDEGLAIIPTYFNGWFGVPPFGGFTRECVKPDQTPPYVQCLKETVEVLKDANILVHDIANEPFNNVCGDQYAFNEILLFLKTMAEVLRRIDSRKITIGTQSYMNENKSMCDIDTIAPLVDVISLHPYNVHNITMDEFGAGFKELLDYIAQFKKPVLITECGWANEITGERTSYLESELCTYKKYGVGYLIQGLFTSPVADLHPIDRIYRTKGLYMAFLDDNFNIRPEHNIFNEI